MAFQGRLPEESADTAPPEVDPAAIATAHDAVRADDTIQFDLADPPVEEPPPDWLLALFNWLAELGPVWRVIFWGLIVLAVVALIVALVPPLRAWVLDRWTGRPRDVDAADGGEWMPEQNRARALLADADALAQAGDYDAAVHLILLRSIDDIEAWRGDRLAPALTARDIAAVPDLPVAARGVFERLVAAVERSLFAGHRLGATDWENARADYAAIALGSA